MVAFFKITRMLCDEMLAVSVQHYKKRKSILFGSILRNQIPVVTFVHVNQCNHIICLQLIADGFVTLEKIM